ncbi:TraB family protein [compost metagenome]
MADHGILKGKQDGSLNLADTLTREQLLSLTYRTYEFVLQESNTASKGLVWKVTGGKSPVYVLGSIHIGDISIYPLDNAIKKAYEGSSYLAVEADITQDAEGIQYMGQKAVFSDGSTLDKHVSAETYKLFAGKMEQAGIAADVYNTLKPWYAALLVQNLSLAEASYSANLGLDVYFLSEAAKTQKPVLQVEGIKFQVDMFDSFDAKLQEEFLLGTLTESEGGADGKDAAANTQAQLMQSLLHYWSTGNAEEFGKLIGRSNEAEAGASEFTRIFWDERNKNMFSTVEKYLADSAGHSYFVVVGAGHLYGDTGVLKELEKAGYTIEQLLD